VRGIEQDVLNRKDPITAMIKLVECCSQSARLFFIAGPATTNTSFQELALAAWQQLNQFEFELKTELRRMGGMEAGRKDFSVPRDPENVKRECASSIQILLEQYKEALTTTLSAHARAMITRQSEEIQKQHDRLLAVNVAA
jgi:hypothetical protein